MAIKTIMVHTVLDKPCVREYKNDEAITPGMLVEITSTGVKKHATAGGTALPIFALENELEGEEIGTALTSGEKGRFWFPQRGDEVLVYVTGSPAVGNYAESAGDGSVTPYEAVSSALTIEPESIVGIFTSTATSNRATMIAI